MFTETRIRRKTGRKSLSRENFIAKARVINGDTFDYSKVVYIDTRTKVDIICSVHGVFSQRPNAHLSQKAGCPKCNRGNPRLTQAEFIARAIKTHGIKYDYSKAIYQTAFVVMEIICPDHGPFFQSSRHHLSGQGCKTCGVIKRAEDRKKTLLNNNKINIEQKKQEKRKVNIAGSNMTQYVSLANKDIVDYCSSKCTGNAPQPTGENR